MASQAQHKALARPAVRRPPARPMQRPAPVLEPAREKAIENYKKQDLDAIAAMGGHYLRCGGHRLAHVVFEGLVAIEPRDPHYALGLGLACDHLGDKNGARRAYQLAGRLDPADGRADANLAELALEAGDRPGAVKLLLSAERKSRVRGDEALGNKASALLELISRPKEASR